MVLIENAWALLKSKVRATHPSNVHELWQYCQEEWAAIPPEYFEKLAYSFPTRCKLIVDAKGHATKY